MDKKGEPKIQKLRNVINRKASIIKEMMNKVDELEACESTCHIYTLKDEVENGKEDIVVENEEFIMKQDMKNKEIIREKKNPEK